MGQQEMKTNEELLKEIKKLKETVSDLEKSKFEGDVRLENSPVCTIVVDLDFNLQYMSRHGADELKVDDITTFYGNPYPFSFYPNSSKIIILENLNRAKKTGNTISQEVPIKDCKGNKIWHHSTITPVNNNQGELDYIQITSLNTTHSKQAETELEESYERFRLVFNQQFQFMAIVSPEGYTMEINDLPLKVQGAKREDYIGKLFWKSPAWENDPNMQKKVKNQFLKASSMQEPLFSEDTFVLKDGTIGTALSTYHAIRDAENNVRHILVQATDITERKNAEEALLKSETTVRNKLKAITDPEGNIDMLELSDIIDVEVLQSIMDDFYQITGMVAAVLDVSGKVLVAVGWQDICTKFHRCNPDSLKNCLESDTILTKGVPEGTCKAYRCKNNMWDIVTPIMIGERHLGNVFMGQYFLEGEVPDVELFRKQAKKYGFDEDEYLKALKKVPHIAKETVEKGMQFYSKLAGLISTLSYSAIKQSKLLSERKLAEEALLKSEEKYRELINLAQEGIWVIDKNNATSFVNPSMAKMLGYSSEEMLGKSLFDFMDEKGIQIANENLERRQSGVKEQHDFEFICKNGDRIITAIETAPIMDSKGEYDGAIAGLINITERKLAEDKIRAAEKHRKDTFDISPSIISTANVNTGYFVQVNQAVSRILGYSTDEFTSKPLMEFIHPDDRQRTVDEISEQQKGNETTFFENRYLCKDGSYKWMAWHSTKADINGEVTAIASDISEQKIIQQEIVATKQFYEDIIEGVQDGIWVTDQNDVIYYANSAMEKIAGIAREEIQGNNVLKDFPEETTGELIQYYKQAQKDKKPVWYDIKVKTPEKKDTWQNGWLIPQFQDTVFVGMICTIRDVTVRKLAEEKVRKLSTAVEQSPTMVVIADTEGDLEYVNPKFIEFTGYSSAEAIGARSNILKSGTHEKSFYTELWNIVKSGKTWRGRFYNKKKNGECFWESASISAILDESGKIINYIKIGEDITQQRNTEIELKNAMEKAVESDRLKSAFLANMSHEIRTPMNGILGFINLLNAPNLSKEKIDKYSDIINKSGDRLLTTINDIIDISKIEAGQMHVSKREVSINNLMEELHSFHSTEANQNGLSLILNPLVSKDITILTDDDKLYGMLTNLIKNAIKYTEQGSITFGCVVKDKAIQFYVEDTGIGIPKDRLHAVFNRFEKADIEEISAFEGSGLGLAISKAYAEMLGGEIFVESEEGKGSKFMFSMPHVSAIKNELEQVDKDSNKVQLRNDKLNLLIVEDDMVSAELLKTLLDDMFHKITHVQSGIDAVEVCKNESEIDLVLMDVKMPVMNGYKATQQIRRFNKDLIIIAQTAYAMLEDKGKALKAGCNDYITKPINKKALFEMINKHLG